MKLESLVIVNHHVTVNDLSNFAHTAHHARRVVSVGHLLSCIKLLYFIKDVKVFKLKNLFFRDKKWMEYV